MTVAAYLILMIWAVWLIGVSVFMLIRPRLALTYLGRFASTNLINCSELIFRLIVGLALVRYAAATQYPTIFLIAGWFLAATAAILMLVPRSWHYRYAVYWSKKLTPLQTRLAAPFSFIAGVLLIAVIN